MIRCFGLQLADRDVIAAGEADEAGERLAVDVLDGIAPAQRGPALQRIRASTAYSRLMNALRFAGALLVAVTLLQLAACSSTDQAASRTPTSEPPTASVEPSIEPAAPAAESEAAAAEYPREIQIGTFGLAIPPVPSGPDNAAACDAYLGEARQGGPLLLGTQTAATADSVTPAQLSEFVRVALAFIAASDGELRTVLERVTEPATLRSVLLAAGNADVVAPPAQADVDALLSVCAAFS